ncbi:MAG: SDR family oxidoreductase [Pseudomonadota bacterium]
MLHTNQAMLNIGVTGANGFVGKSLCSELLAKGYKVTAFTRDSRHQSGNIHYRAIDDISASTSWNKALDNIDVLVHLAARVHVMHDVAKDPLQAFLDVNLHGTVNLAKAAAQAGVKRFVFMSSIKVNGELTGSQPFSESDVPQPQDAYAISKWEAEKALREIEKQTGMEVVILRPPLVYGAGVKANFAALLKVVNKKIPLPLASVKAKRSSIFLGNLVDAVIVCTSNPKAAGQTYLVSDGEALSTPQLIKKMAFALNKPSYVLPFPVSMMRLFAKAVGKLAMVERLTQSLVIDHSKIQQELGWRPPFTLDQGLKVTADWYLKSLQKKH